jgi:hypothetical protein
LTRQALLAPRPLLAPRTVPVAVGHRGASSCRG